MVVWLKWSYTQRLHSSWHARITWCTTARVMRIVHVPRWTSSSSYMSKRLDHHDYGLETTSFWCLAPWNMCTRWYCNWRYSWHLDQDHYDIRLSQLIILQLITDPCWQCSASWLMLGAVHAWSLRNKFAIAYAMQCICWELGSGAHGQANDRLEGSVTPRWSVVLKYSECCRSSLACMIRKQVLKSLVSGEMMGWRGLHRSIALRIAALRSNALRGFLDVWMTLVNQFIETRWNEQSIRVLMDSLKIAPYLWCWPSAESGIHKKIRLNKYDELPGSCGFFRHPIFRVRSSDETFLWAPTSRVFNVLTFARG